MCAVRLSDAFIGARYLGEISVYDLGGISAVSRRYPGGISQVINGVSLEALIGKLHAGNLDPKVRDLVYIIIVIIIRMMMMINF